MRRLKSIIIYSIVFMGLLLFFAPKLQLYFALEQQLERQNIKISQEGVSDKGFCLEISEGNLYYTDLYVGKFETLSMVSALLFNRMSVENFLFSEEMSRFAKGSVHNVNITHHIVAPLTLYVSADADMGDITAQVHLKDRNVSVHFTPSEEFLKQPPFWLNKMKKSQEGGYAFETTY